MKKLDFVKTTAVASIFAATIAASPAFANTTATFTVSDDAVKEIATIQRSMMEDADESDSTSYEAGDEMAEGYLDPLDIQNDMPDAVSDEDLLEGEDAAVEVEVNSDTVILPTPEREGYVFIEWNSESDGSGESFQAGDTFVITSEVELFAIWEEKERSSLTLNFNEDSFVKENFFEEEEEGVTVHAVSTRSAGTSKNAEEAVKTETGSEEIALEDSESTEISETDSKDAETGSEEVDESSLDKVETEDKETTKSSTDSSQDAEQVSEKDDTVEEEKVSDDKESEESENDSSSKDDDSDSESGSDESDDDSSNDEKDEEDDSESDDSNSSEE
ncbi:InlB B-repeat-containing protein [Oribacterium sp. FC2011]|uniref:InlB B-repeat-containing protein n=1 Tax=Oribacterium sp. FC2011 TaxID=1408311 RepID=UPI0004E14834|nr:InlB B-repeat-containing protein [Oribacterium sp. FC2011]